MESGFCIPLTAMSSLRIVINPYADVFHARAIVEILDSYASDPMGGGESLAPRTRQNLIAELRRRPWIVTLLALREDQPVGLLIAIEGFSTFSAKPLLNIHDVAVLPECRGQGIGVALFAEG